MKRLLVALAMLSVTGCGSEVAANDPRLPEPTQVPVPTGVVQPLGSTRVAEIDGVERLCLADDGLETCQGPTLEGWDWDDFEPPHDSVEGDFQVSGGDYTGSPGNRSGTFEITGRLEPGGDVLHVESAAVQSGSVSILVDGSDSLLDQCRDLDPGHGRSDVGGGEETVRFNELPASDGLVRTHGFSPSDGDTVLAVWVHGDDARAVDAVRSVWPGPLCVIGSALSRDAAEQAVDDLGRLLPGALTTSTEDPTAAHRSSTLSVSVIYDDGSLQQWVNQEYGPGLIDVSSMLIPALEQ